MTALLGEPNMTTNTERSTRDIPVLLASIDKNKKPSSMVNSVFYQSVPH